MKYKTILYILMVMLNTGKIIAQNLVPNPSFEIYDTCPTMPGQIRYAIPWTNPIYTSTPDYFNACNLTNLNVPNNLGGYENARTGDAYADIVTDVFASASNNYREYLQVKLLKELEVGIKYCVKFYVSACDSVNYISNDIGVFFSQNEIRDTIIPATFPLPYSPQFENSKNLNSKDGWTEVSGEFIASGGEKYIVIGNFKDHNSTISTYTGWATNTHRQFALYFIDDVSVFRCDLDSLVEMPNIFTPNSDGLNDVFSPLQKPNISSGMLKIFNRWGKEIYSTNDIYEGWDGKNSSDGVYYWELKYTDLIESNHISVGYVLLIR